MKNYKCFKYLILFPILFFFACEDPEFDTGDYESKVVVDGWIEQGKYPQVLLTRSAPYFSVVDSVSLRKYVVTTATVTVSDGINSEILTLRPNKAYFPPYVYVGSSLKGQVGHTYYLTVNSGGKTITATTTIPELSYLDSAYFKLNEGDDSLGLVYIKFTDNADHKNYYRTMTQRKSIDSKYIANYVSNYKDDYFNGSSMEMALYKGNASNLEKQDDIYYRLGDTISLKFCSVDQSTYNFWNSFQFELINTSNPFASSNARIKSNVTNGLGVWCGYGAVYYQIKTNQ